MCVLASAFYCSCTNEEDTSKPNAKTVALRDIQEFSYYNNGNIVKMLSFNSIDDFLAAVDRLKADDEEYNERFYSQFAENFERDSMFFVIEEDYNFDNQRIYKDFERQFDYKSMRSVYDSLESEWLSREDLRDTATCPDRLFPYTTEEQTLFNEYGEVKIGDVILKMIKGDYVVFKNCDTVSLVRYNNGDNSVLNNSEIESSLKFHEETLDCQNEKQETVIIEKPFGLLHNGDIVFIPFCKTKIHSSFYNCWFYARMKSDAKVCVWNGKKHKYEKAGMNQKLILFETKLYDRGECNHLSKILSSKTESKCKHKIEVSSSTLELVNHYRIHQWDTGVRYRINSSNCSYYIKFWDYVGNGIQYDIVNN